MKLLFILVACVHGLMHLNGFYNAFLLHEKHGMMRRVTKLEGALFLLTALGFILVVLLRLIGNPFWISLIMISIAVSQILVFISWQDLKIATVINGFLLILVLPAFGNQRFRKMVDAERESMFSAPVVSRSASDSVQLPDVVRKWMNHSGATGPIPRIIEVKQRGRMRTEPNGRWLNFTSVQNYRTDAPSFIWEAHVKYFPGVFMTGFDRLRDGVGSMQIQLLGLLDLVVSEPGVQVNEGSILRYLGELCWFPEAAASPYIHWQQTGPLTATATMQSGQTKATGTFIFSPSGDLISYTAERYYGSGADAKKERWEVINTRHGLYNGVRIPDQCEVTWKLKDGDFTWLNLEVVSVKTQD